MYYHLLDLSRAQQKAQLDALAKDQPALYHQVKQWLDSGENEAYTELFAHHAQHLDQPSLSLTGVNIGRYSLQEEIGRGGMGVVYCAKRADDTFEQDLAIKFIQPSTSSILGQQTLFHEAQILAHLNHPYIAKVFDGGLYQDMVYIAMEKVEGQTLSQYLQSTPLEQKEALRLVEKVALALEHAHQKHILHADLKPDNILIDRDGNPKLIDFNITQKVRDKASQSPDFIVACHREFASPEQCQGDYLTAQSDVFSLGKIMAVIFKTLSRTQPRYTISKDLALIINKATQQQSEARYPSMAALRQDIQHLLTRRPISLRNQPTYRLILLLRRRPVTCGLAFALLLSATVFTNAIIKANAQLKQEKVIAEDMMFEVTSLLYHSKNIDERSFESMLDVTRRRILASPDLPDELKQKMLFAMMTPIPKKHYFGSSSQGSQD